MAIVKSPLFTELRDKIADLEFRMRRNKKIELAKKRVPSNPRTSKQMKIRQIYRQCVKKYNQLTDEEKAYYVQKYRKENLDAYRAFMKECLSQNLPETINEITIDNSANLSETIYEITIDNSANPNQLTDYQILLNISGDSQFFQDCQNNPYAFYFLNEEQTAKIPFYREEFDITNYNAKIWLKVPSIPAEGNVKLYMLIDPNRTTDESNPEQVFEFFDDFEGTELDTTKWEPYGTVSVSVSDSKLSISTELYQYGAIKTKTTFPSRNTIFEVCRIHDGGNSIFTYLTDYDATSNPWKRKEWYCDVTYDTNLYKAHRYTDPDPDQIGLYKERMDYNVWRVYAIAIDSTNIRYLVNNVQKYAETCEFETTDNLYLHIGARDEGAASVDWVRVRKYTEPAPTATYKKLQN